MSDDIIKVSGTTKAYKPFKGGAVDIPYPVKGVVKNTIDSARTGRIQVYIQQFGSNNPDDSKSWVSVSYLSPFYGMTPGANTDKTGYGNFKNNPHSYGWWSTPPDIGTEVICVFLNGKRDFGYYIGCIPQIGLNQMIPAIGASSRVVPNGSEASAYGGAKLLPVTEMNDNNQKLSNSPTFMNETRPVHSVVAGQFAMQGLITDPVRGPITSSAMRESPSRVFGISTPGRPIYSSNLGSNDTEIASKISTSTKEKLKIIARRGGHTFVMDDGDVQGSNQLIRLRTSAGHQITMSDDGQTLFITHANGQSYIELGKEGTVDIFSTNSFNVRTQGDINFHADNDINLHAEKHLNVYAEQINVNSDKDTNIKVGTDFSQQTSGDHTLQVDKAMSMNSTGEASYSSDATTYINGSIINLNTGSAGLTPQEVDPIPQNAHTDTLYQAPAGWTPAPGKLQSVVSRAPAHMPWLSASKGINVESDSDAEGEIPESPSAEVQEANDFAPDDPSTPTTEATVATVPPVSDTEIGGNFDASTTSAMVSQSAVNASSLPGGADAVANGAGIIATADGKVAGVGKMLQSPTALEAAGTLKPGSGALVNKLISSGKNINEAMPTNLFTGKGGVTSLTQYVNNNPAQISNQIDSFNKGSEGLKTAGVISGKESPTQIAGLVSGAAAFGVGAVTSFVKQTGSGLNPTIGGNKSLVSNIGGAISSGNFAANLADKNSPASALSGGGVSGAVAGLKGAIGKAFDNVKSTFASLTGDKPTTLTGADVPTSLAGATGLPDGMGDNLKSSLSGLANNPSATLAGLTTSVPDAGSLSSAMAAIPTGGSPQIKLPELASDTFNRAGINSQAKSLLGGGVPLPITSGGALNIKPPSPDQVAAYNANKKELDTTTDEYWTIKKRYGDLRYQKGPDDPETIAAQAELKANIQKQEEIRQKMATSVA